MQEWHLFSGMTSYSVEELTDVSQELASSLALCPEDGGVRYFETFIITQKVTRDDIPFIFIAFKTPYPYL
jgi:hypothetical protein